MVYFIALFLSALCCYTAQTLSSKYKKVSIVFEVISVLIPSVIAGIRNEYVGYDVRLYLNHIFDIACYSSSLIEYISIIKGIYHNIGMGFSVITYLASCISNDKHSIYFIANLLTMTCFYIGTCNNEKYERVFCWIMILFLFYNLSLNLIRQTCAISILFLARIYIYKENLIKYLVLCLVAITKCAILIL